LIKNANVQMGKGTDFYMYHDDNGDGKHASIMVSIHSNEINLEQGEHDDLGLGFKNIQPIPSLLSNVDYVTFFDQTIELSYECKINYINASRSTCFNELVK